MIVSLLFIFILSFWGAHSIQKPTRIYEPIDLGTFSKFSKIWEQTHASWIGIDPNQKYCNHSFAWTSYPVCIGDEIIQENHLNLGEKTRKSCGRAQCIVTLNGQCGITPADTIDYTPPPASTSLDNSTICPLPAYFDQIVSNYSYSLEQGIPPEYLPISPIGLNISGKVFSNFNGKCQEVPNAEIVAWQLNSLYLTELTSDAKKRYSINVANQTDSDLYGPYTQESQMSLRDRSCRVMQHSAEDGSFNFITTMPPSYGPPRHIMFSISAPGFSNLTTRMYFDKDWRLQQLTTQEGNVQSRSPGSKAQQFGFSNDMGFSERIFPGAVSKDPRVAFLRFVHHNETKRLSGLVKGHFEVNFNFYLAPLRESDSGDSSNSPPMDINGIWANEEGSMVQIETHGTVFTAREYPHPRVWNMVNGYLVGNSIRGVSFYQNYQRNDLVEISDSLLSISKSIQSDSLSHGSIIPFDSFASAPFTDKDQGEMTIQWSGGGYDSIWTKQTYRQQPNPRYIKILIVRSNGARPESNTGQLIINEIYFYEGILQNYERPTRDMKMQFPRVPSPQIVTCSSFTDQDHHCYKAFDGDSSSSSAWVSNPVGINRNVLAEPQWILLDNGPGRGIRPTAMRIVCDVAGVISQGARGCPMTFAVMTSSDNVKFDTVFRADLYDYNTTSDYTSDGKMFYFSYDNPHGRVKGQRCGSCEKGPYFTCNINAHDISCDSRFCNLKGLCDDLPQCPAGQYLSVDYSTSYSSPVFTCQFCAAGRYGNSSGLTSNKCSGQCSAGYFCPAGSTQPTAYECGGPHVFCPVGSGMPIPAPAGRVTVPALGSTSNLTNSLSTQGSTKPCDPGHFCVNGAQYKCPVGRYGAVSLLPSSLCTDICLPGTHCPEGSVSPFVCPEGNYCPDGRYPVPCPAGRYGNRSGLMDEYCAGECPPGYYCEAGTVSPYTYPCRAGLYGSGPGLANDNCNGPCQEGYYCPLASFSPRQNPCGGSDVYCPVGSPEPVKASPGYYTIGGNSETTRSNQTIAEIGYFAMEGLRYACPSGTYGATKGFDANDYSFAPTMAPTPGPTKATAYLPSAGPRPSSQPTSQPSIQPSRQPLRHPTSQPSRQPSRQPSSQPTLQPGLTQRPMADATELPTSHPTTQMMSTSKPTFAPSTSAEYIRKRFVCSGICSAGYYCPSNSTEQIPCPAGRYGLIDGLKDKLCTAVCPLGNYCPAGSVRPTPCPPGVFGASVGLIDSTCSSDCTPGVKCDISSSTCKPGYYCPRGSITSTQYQCGGPDKYCPAGSPEPFPVSFGFYSIGDPDPNIRSDQVICDVGHFCVSGVRSKCPPGRYGNSQGLASSSCSGPCPPGHYCPSGTFNATQYRCPAGRYGATYGLTSSSCTSECDPGFHCDEGSVSATQLHCAELERRQVSLTEWSSTIDGTLVLPEANNINIDSYVRNFNTTIVKSADATGVISRILSEPNSVYCPAGTSHPIFVLPGYYSINNNKTTRSDQRECPAGSYCIDGVRYSCPAGTYGALQKMTSAKCSGLCPKGFYCPAGSDLSVRYRCPIGRYGSEEGLSSPECSGTCPRPLDCPAGSITKAPKLPV